MFPLLMFFLEEPGLKLEAKEPAGLVDVGMVVKGGSGETGSASDWLVFVKVSHLVEDLAVVGLVYL